MFNALKKIPGIDSPTEAADGSKHGVLWAPNTMDATNHTRSYAKLGHYDSGPIARTNFYLLPAHRVVRVHLGFSEDTESWTADGVSFTPRDGDGQVASVKARREVIVSAGTMHTPQVLERSGIGPKAILEAAGVPVKVNLPGVGYNFQSHTSITVGFRFTRDVFPTEADLRTNRTFRLEAEEQWEANKTGPYSALVNSGVFLPFPVFSNNTAAIISKLEDQSPEQYLPEELDTTVVRGYAVQKQILIRQLQSTKSAWLESLFFGQSSLGAILLHIFSRGSVHISPADDGISTDPVIDYRAFTNPVDLDLNVELLKGVRWFMGHDAMVEALGPVETSPRLTDDESIRSWIRRTVNANVAHQVGTSALGPLELGGVVGPDLRVHGVLGLSIADNSIMPLVIGSHTSSTAYAIGEKVR
jgi:choline dehydrogenase-like flavoprotein